MTTTNGTVADQAESLIEARNERGIRVGGEWRNLSKFHPLGLPGQGARVRLELDGKGFIKSLQVLDVAPAASSSGHDRTITRLSVLKIAAAFLAQMGHVHEGVKSNHVIPLAEKWLAWVEQEGDEQPAYFLIRRHERPVRYEHPGRPFHTPLLRKRRCTPTINHARLFASASSATCATYRWPSLPILAEPATDDLILERLPSGQHAWLRPEPRCRDRQGPCGDPRWRVKNHAAALAHYTAVAEDTRRAVVDQPEPLAFTARAQLPRFMVQTQTRCLVSGAPTPARAV